MTRVDEGNKYDAQAQEIVNSKILHWRQSRLVRREAPGGAIQTTVPDRSPNSS